ncbi:hypothetical protein AALP_AA2G174000 [Arabis alpina]|uniref:MATH domain-containing protein n=1 Tax=Arabis alpina TaxID=50452 RepID=A0A087HI51_ARAAL|nr:hypothetical protein AALP_AA2G174000 [Arabis alpina]
MYTEEKKQKNYGSIFIYCFFCFVLVVEVARFAKPYYNDIQNLMETEAEAVVEEGLFDVELSGARPCEFSNSRSAQNHQKLSIPIRQEIRARPPTTYCVKFQSFATMSNLVKSNGNMYESRPFSAGGYNWTLLIYPNVNTPVGSGGYVSLYVKLDNSTFIDNPGGEVYAEITFLTYKSTIDKYHILKETDAQRFHLFKQQFGQLNFLEIAYYQNAAHGFIFDGGQSVFGVDILVTPPFKQWEVASYEKNIQDPVYTWKLTKFSIRNLDSYTSDTFSSGGRNWKLKVYPNGTSSAAGNSLSLYLVSASGEKGYVQAKLRVIGTTKVEKQVEGYPDAKENGWGLEKYMPLADLKDTSRGFLAGDALKVEVEILSFSKTDSFTK